MKTKSAIGAWVLFLVVLCIAAGVANVPWPGFITIIIILVVLYYLLKFVWIKR
jgi:membrane protein YqaA with SNARE-associated domain